MRRPWSWLRAVSLFPLVTSDAIDLIELHGPDKQTVFLNEHEISTLRAPTSTDLRRYFPPGVHCVVVTTNGRFLGVVEPCPVIRDLLAQKRGP